MKPAVPAHNRRTLESTQTGVNLNGGTVKQRIEKGYQLTMPSRKMRTPFLRARARAFSMRCFDYDRRNRCGEMQMRNFHMSPASVAYEDDDCAGRCFSRWRTLAHLCYVYAALWVDNNAFTNTPHIGHTMEAIGGLQISSDPAAVATAALFVRRSPVQTCRRPAEMRMRRVDGCSAGGSEKSWHSVVIVHR